MKHFRHIQNLFLFFTLFFLASGLGLILAFQNHIAIVAALALVCLTGVWLMVRALLTLRGYFHAFKQREARLILLASRDPATGLFERNGFEGLLSQEIERAKRRDYTLTLLLIQVEPLAKIQNDIGATATDRLMFQIGESLQKHCRCYDSAFKIDAGTFALYFAETHAHQLGPIIKRLQKRLQNTAFLVNAERMKITPVFKLGAAIYPLDGTNPQTLENFARTNLSETFDLTKLRHPEKPQHEFYEVLPTSSAPANTTPDETPLMVASEKAEAVVIPPEPTAVEENFTPNFSTIDTQQLKGTPEMTAFQDEINALFARTQSLEKNVKKLLSEEPAVLPQAQVAVLATASAANQTVAPTNEKPKTLANAPLAEPQIAATTSHAEPAEAPQPKPHNKTEKIGVLCPLKNPEPLPLIRQPLPGQQYFQTVAKPSETANTEIQSAPPLTRKPLPTAATPLAPSAAWSAEEIADLPDVVAALMQNEISRL